MHSNKDKLLPSVDSRLMQAVPQSLPMPASGPEADPRLQILAMIQAPLYLFDVELFAIVWANQSAVHFWEAISAQELYARDFKASATATIKLRVKQIKQSCFERQHPFTELWTVYPNGKPKTADFEMTPFTREDGTDVLLMRIKDGTTMPDHETAYRTTALMHTSTMISAYTQELDLVYCNAAARESMPDKLDNGRQRLVHRQELRDIINTLTTRDHCDAEVEVNTAVGVRWHALHVQRCTNPTSGNQMYLVTETDINEQVNAKEEAYRLAFTDSLTGLPNRAALSGKLDELLSATEHGSFAILFLDLDRFKVINDSLGHAVGDQLLIDVSQRLRQALGEQGTVYRLGGDEFVMLTTKSTQYEDLRQIAENILYSMANPVVVSGHKLRVLPSIGISSYPDDGQALSLIMDNADAAMYIAKANQCGYCFYDAKMTSSITENVKDRMGLETDMVAAFDNGEFELYFQPKISCRNLSVASVEALIRWNHPERGMVSPDKFIGIAEETGQIIDLGNWVLRAAMRQQRSWHDQGLSVPVSVNISARQFSANDLLANVSDALAQTGCDPHMIELEITESMLIGEPDGVHATLQQLSAMGIKLALDDFGTGYSNLAYLQKYPLDCIKIDKIFLADRKRSMLMGTILKMGKVLGLQVVAEGVETSTQADWLIAHGCDLLQGFYFSRPKPEAEATQYLIDNGIPRHDIDNVA